MKVVHIDSAKSEVSEIDIVPSPDELARLCGSHPSKVATLPSGDILLAGVGDASRAGFSIGGSAPIRSSGLVIGKRDTWRGFTPARSSAGLLGRLVRWVYPEPPPETTVGDTVKVLLIDPTTRTVERKSIARAMTAIEKLVGVEVRLAFRAPDGDQVYSARGAEGDRWRKDDVEFVGRCIVVGTDRTGGMADAAISIDAFKKTVRFNSGKPDRWMRYREEASGGRQYLFEVRQNG
jgi:hypothetical protein